MSSNTSIRFVCAVVGDNAFMMREALNGVITWHRRDAGQDVEVTTIDGASASTADVLDEVRTYSFLGARRVVVVESAEAFMGSADHRTALERYCKEPSSTGSLVLCCRKFNKSMRLYKQLAAGGQIIDCPALTQRSAGSWVLERARQKYDKTMSPATAALIASYAGPDAGLLDMELSKLSTYVGARDMIERDDVEALVGHSREQKVFALLDAMADGQAGRALSTWRQVVATDPAAIGRSVGGLAYGVRQLLSAHRAFDAGERVETLSRRLYARPDQLEQRFRRVSTRQLERRLADLVDVDVAIKTGSAGFDSAVEKWIVRHSCPA